MTSEAIYYLWAQAECISPQNVALQNNKNKGNEKRKKKGDEGALLQGIHQKPIILPEQNITNRNGGRGVWVLFCV